MKTKKSKGYTLIEILVATGVIGLASIGIYNIGLRVSDWRKSSQEFKALSKTFLEIENSNIANVEYIGINKDNLRNYSSGFNTVLNLSEINAESSTKLNFIYRDMSPRICSDFVSKMVSSSENVTALVNSVNINENKLNDIGVACSLDSGLNTVTIALNKRESDYTLATVVASINAPPSPPVDAPIPSMPLPQVPPVINPYTPSGLNPGTYPLVTGGAPTFTPGPGGGGPIIVTSPPGSINPVTPSVPNWNPPNVVRPGAPYNPPDQLDQDPNPPPPPPPPPPPTFYSKQIKTCITGYAVNHLFYNCSNGLFDATLTLTLASPWDNFGRENFIFPRGLEHCTSGEPGFYIGYNQTYPQVTDQEMFWQATQYYDPRKMFIKTFNNINSYIFTCAQTG